MASSSGFFILAGFSTFFQERIVQGLEHDSPFMVSARLGAEAAGRAGWGSPPEHLSEASSGKGRRLSDLFHYRFGISEVGAHSLMSGVCRVRLAGESFHPVTPGLLAREFHPVFKSQRESEVGAGRPIEAEDGPEIIGIFA